MLSSTAVGALFGALLIGSALLGIYCAWSLRRESRGLEIHAHADGTVHEHHRGSRPHDHPTLADLHEQVIQAIFRETVRR